VCRPDTAGRVSILAALTRAIALSPDVDLEQIACRTDGFSGADLKSVVGTAQLALAHETLEAALSPSHPPTTPAPGGKADADADAGDGSPAGTAPSLVVVSSATGPAPTAATADDTELVAALREREREREPDSGRTLESKSNAKMAHPGAPATAAGPSVVRPVVRQALLLGALSEVRRSITPAEAARYLRLNAKMSGKQTVAQTGPDPGGGKLTQRATLA